MQSLHELASCSGARLYLVGQGIQSPGSYIVTRGEYVRTAYIEGQGS